MKTWLGKLPNLLLIAVVLAGAVIPMLPERGARADIPTGQRILSFQTGANITYRSQIVTDDQYIYNISIDAQAHIDYGFGYPVTYVFLVPAGSSNLTAQRRYLTSQNWTSITTKTSSEMFNGIEAVRYDYNKNRAYVSVAYSSVSDDIYVRINNSVGSPVEIHFAEIAKYYDNRAATVLWTADDYGSSGNWSAAFNYAQSHNVTLTTAVIVGNTDAGEWALLQTEYDEGNQEIAVHSFSHNTSLPYPDYDLEIGVSKASIAGNITFSGIYTSGSQEYIWAWVEPGGSSDATVRSKLGEYKYLADRAVSNGTSRQFATWDSTNNVYNRQARTIEMSGLGTTNITTLNASFDNAYGQGEIYIIISHPGNLDTSVGGYVDLHLQHVGNRTDVWYPGLGAMYAYRYLAEPINGSESAASSEYHYSLSDNLTNFPVRVHLDSSNFDFSSVAADLSDLQFRASDNVTVLVADNTSWNGVDDAIIWVSANITANTPNYSEYIILDPDAAANWGVNTVWSQAGAMGVWHLEATSNNGTQVFDSTANANTGNVTPTTIWTASGRTFNGTDTSVNTTMSNLALGTGNFSIIWSSKGTGTNFFASIMSQSNHQYSSLNSGWDIVNRTATDIGLNFVHTTYANVVTWAGQEAYMADSTWHQWQLIGDRTTANVSLIRDNINQGTRAPGGSFATANIVGTNNFRIGKTGTSSTRYFTGEIGEVQIYSKTLNTNESQAHFLSGIEELLFYGDGILVASINTLPTSGVSVDKDSVTTGNFSGNITSLGGSPTLNYWIESGLTASYGTVSANYSANTTGVVYVPVSSNLTPGQTYHFRIVATNADGTTYGSDQTFTLTMPTVVGGAGTVVGGSQVTLNGNVTNLGVASSYYKFFEYWGLDGVHHTTTETTGTAIGSFSDTVEGISTVGGFSYRAGVRVGTVFTYGATATLNPVYTGTDKVIIIVPVIIWVGLLIAFVILFMKGYDEYKAGNQGGANTFWAMAMIFIAIDVILFSIVWEAIQAVLGG